MSQSGDRLKQLEEIEKVCPFFVLLYFIFSYSFNSFEKYSLAFMFFLSVITLFS